MKAAKAEPSETLSTTLKAQAGLLEVERGWETIHGNSSLKSKPIYFLGGLLEVAVVVFQRLVHLGEERLKVRRELRQPRQRGGLVGIPSGRRRGRRRVTHLCY